MVVYPGGAFLGWLADADGKLFVQAVIGDLPASTVVASGSAGVLEYVDGGPRFRLDNALVAAPKLVFPAVAAGGGKKGDVLRCQVFGAVRAVFLTQLDTTANKLLESAAGTVVAKAAVADNVLWGVVLGAGADSKTQNVFLAGVALGT